MSLVDDSRVAGGGAHLPSPKNSVAQSSSLKIAQLVSQCCSRGQIGCNTATVPASVHFIVACVVYYLNDPVSASCEVFVIIGCGIKVSYSIFNRKLKHVLTGV